MKLDLQPLLDTFLVIVDRVGAKAAVTLAICGALIYLAVMCLEAGLVVSLQFCIVGIAAVGAIFMIARSFEKDKVKLERPNGQ